MSSDIHYDIQLPEEVDNILSVDFWMLEHLNKDLLMSATDPVKFSASTSVYVRKGTALADINLITLQIAAPCIVNIHQSQILQLKYVSDDFDATFVVLSKRFTDNLFVLLKDCRLYSTACRFPMIPIPEYLLPNFEEFMKRLKEISEDKENPFAYQAQAMAMAAFFYHIGTKCYMPFAETFHHNHNRIIEAFINLVQQHFRKERFLEFYSSILEITPKHLSRTLKSMTGITAVEWIDRYVILEAKVLLKSSNLSIQQISNDLNFSSQSFFGKYFKKHVGMSPKEFRNK